MKDSGRPKSTRNKTLNKKYYSEDFVNPDCESFCESFLDMDQLPDKSVQELSGAQDARDTHAGSPAPGDSKTETDNMEDSITEMKALLKNEQLSEATISEVNDTCMASQTVLDKLDSTHVDSRVEVSQNKPDNSDDTDKMDTDNTDNKSEGEGEVILSNQEANKLNEIERVTHSIDILTRNCQENHGQAIRVIIESGDKMMRSIQESRCSHDKQISSLQADVATKSEKIAQMKLEITYLEKEVNKLKPFVSDCEIAHKRCHDLELEMQHLIDERKSEQAIHELKVQSLELELKHAQDYKDLMCETNASLKDRLASLTMTENMTQTSHSQGIHAATSQDSATLKEYKVKYTEGLNPILSAFDTLDPRFKWNNEEFRSAEAVFQCEKLSHAFCTLPKEEKVKIKQRIMEAECAKDAKRIGDTEIPWTKQWEEYQFQVMENIQKEKMEQYQSFREKLCETKDGIITHPVGDPVWREKFPEILVKVRDDYLSKNEGEDPIERQRRIWRHSFIKIPKDHKYGLYGDSLFNEADLTTFPRGTCRVPCSTCEQLVYYAREAPVNNNAEVVLNSIGINDLRDGKSPEEVADGVCEALTEINRLCPNAKVCYSAMIAKKGSSLVGPVEVANSKIEEFCDSNYIIFMKHSTVMKSPNLFRDNDDVHLKDYRLYYGRIKKELPRRDRTPSPSPRGRVGAPGNFYRGRGYGLDMNQGPQRSRGRARGRGRYQGGAGGPPMPPHFVPGRGRGYNSYPDSYYHNPR